MKVKFINHASILIEVKGISILTDPWFFGGVFNNGWHLLFENEKTEIFQIIRNVDYIWFSHEHPDHFNIEFIKFLDEVMPDQKPKVFFQKTKDRRVANYLAGQGIEVIQLDDGESFWLCDDVELRCYVVGGYDSALLIKQGDYCILNTNDCELRTKKVIERLFNRLGVTEINCLFSQFSYAAWKGGPENLAWRQKAAREKRETLLLQAAGFRCRSIVPFASYCYFSRQENFYLNDSVNSPGFILEYLSEHWGGRVILPKPGDIVLSDVLLDAEIQSNNSIASSFWDNRMNCRRVVSGFGKDHRDLQPAVNALSKRAELNSTTMMVLAKFISFGYLFGECRVRVIENDEIWRFRVLPFQGVKASTTSLPAHISMRRSDLFLLCATDFGLDTLSVNGCFEEMVPHGFNRMVRFFWVW